jgi:hypothetical protein
MALIASALNTDFTPAIGDFIAQADGGTVMLLRRNAAGAPFAQCGTIAPGQAVVVANPVAGAVYRAEATLGSPTFRADQ